MSEVKKECWIKKTECRLFNIKIWESTVWCDSSNFNKENGSYLVPKCFQSEEHDRQ